MEKSQETQVTAPVEPVGFTREPAPAKLEVHSESKAVWYWCPSCKFASGKVGTCPGCRTPYVAAPEAGVPGTPHMPKVALGRSRAALLGSLAGAASIFAGVAAGIFLLASHGASTIDSGATASTGSTVDGTSSFGVGVLHGTLRLQGTWGASMQRLQLPSNITAGATLKTDLSIGKGGDTLLIGSFPATDPSTVLNQFVITKPQDSADAMGNRITSEPSRDVSIAGYTAVAQDFEVRNGKGGLINRGTLYAVNAGNQVVIVRSAATPVQYNDLQGIEQALTNIG